MASVTFLSAVGGDNSVVTDDSNASTGLGNGGHRTRFVPALSQLVAIANNTVTQAANAATNASTATTQAATATTQASNASASFLSIDKKYLGAKSGDPTLDNQGAALATGATYWNTPGGKLRVYNGSAWIDGVSSTDTGVTALAITGAAATARPLKFQTAGVDRFQMYASTTAESGSNAGSNLNISRYSDAGALIDTPISVARSTGAITFSNSSVTMSQSDASAKLAIYNFSSTTARFPGINISNYTGNGSSDFGGYSALSMYRMRGTSGTPAIISAGDQLGAIIGYGYTGSANDDVARIDFYAGTVWNGTTDNRGKIVFSTQSGTTLAQSMVIDETGNVTATGTISGSSATGFRNKLLNSGMRIWQRGSSFSATGYMADRWNNFVAGTVAVTKSTNPDSPNNNYWQVWTTSAGSSYVNTRQYLESTEVHKLRGKVITIWANAKATGAAFTGTLSANLLYSNSTDASASVTTVVASGTGVALTSTPQLVKLTTTVPADAVGLSAQWLVSAAQNNGVVVSIADFYLEDGSVITPAEQRHEPIELLLCQRYYQKSYPEGVYAGAATAAGNCDYYVASATTANLWYSVRFPRMRATPTVTVYDRAGNVNKLSKGSTNNISALIFDTAEGSFLCGTTDATSTQNIAFQYTLSAEL